MSTKRTSPTPAGIPRSRSRWTRRERAEIRRNYEEVEAQARAYRELYGEDDFNDDYEPVDDDGPCETCGGIGFIVTCCDDLCQGSGGCIHGDGEVPCPDCGGF